MAILQDKFLIRSGILTILIFGNVAVSTSAILDEDTVVIGELDSLLETEEGLPSRAIGDRSPAYTNINGHQIKISCKTARNVDGECRPFGECYPIFKLRDMEGKQKNRHNSVRYNENRVNDELQNLYRGVSGSCSKLILESISKALGYPVPNQNYVCCPMETHHTQTSGATRPDDYAMPPSYQNQQCGGYVSRAENETNSSDTQQDYVEPRIVNGRVAGRSEFPFTVALMMNGRKQFCAGSLIDANHVLTAAHCIYFMNRADVQSLRLQLGDHNIYSTTDGPHETRGASNVYYHRGFSMKTLTDDVALIRLSYGVNSNNYIKPVCLSTNSWAWESHTASVAGWGQVADGGQQSSVLRTVNVRIWRQNECVRKYQGRAPAGITNGMLCSGGDGYDSCKGDSGGPLTVYRNQRAEQLGIVSWGIGCGNYPGVYTRVDMYLFWINKNRR